MITSTSTLHQILLFLQDRILSGEILDLPSIEHESHIRSKIDTASYEFLPFSTNRQFFLLMQKLCGELTCKGRYMFTPFIAEIDPIVSCFLKNAEADQQEANENAIIALFLHSLFYSTDPFYPNGLSETLAYLILLHKRCQNSELANDLLKLAKFYLKQSIFLNEKDECYIDLVNFIINPLIGEEVQCSVDFLGLKNQIDLWNEPLSKGSLVTQSLPYKFILAENELESFIEHFCIHYSEEVMNQLYIFEGDKRIKTRLST